MTWTIKASKTAYEINLGEADPHDPTHDSAFELAAWMGVPLLDDEDLATMIRESAIDVVVSNGETSRTVRLRGSTVVELL